MRIVLDTNILARAFLGPRGFAREILRLSLHPPHILILSPFLVVELSRVLRYERMRKAHGQADAEIDRFVAALQGAAVLVPSPSAAPQVVADD